MRRKKRAFVAQPLFILEPEAPDAKSPDIPPQTPLDSASDDLPSPPALPSPEPSPPALPSPEPSPVKPSPVKPSPAEPSPAKPPSFGSSKPKSLNSKPVQPPQNEDTADLPPHASGAQMVQEPDAASSYSTPAVSPPPDVLEIHTQTLSPDEPEIHPQTLSPDEPEIHPQTLSPDEPEIHPQTLSPDEPEEPETGLQDLFEQMFPGLIYRHGAYQDPFSVRIIQLPADPSRPKASSSTRSVRSAWRPALLEPREPAMFHISILIPAPGNSPIGYFQLEKERVEAAKHHTLLLVLPAAAFSSSSIESALMKADVYAASAQIHGPFADLKEKLEAGMAAMLEQMAPNRSLIDHPVERTTEILSAMQPNLPNSVPSARTEINQKALEMMAAWLHQNHQSSQTVTMPLLLSRFQNAPYGWRPLDIAWCAARLWGKGVIRMEEAHQPADPFSIVLARRMTDPLRCGTLHIRLKHHLKTTLYSELKDFLPVYFPGFSIPARWSDLPAVLVRRLSESLNHYAHLLDQYHGCPYPDQDKLQTVYHEILGLLQLKQDPEALLEEIVRHQEDLLVHQAQLDDLEYFFESQRPVFDQAWRLLQTLALDQPFLPPDHLLEQDIQPIREILNLEQPYERMDELPPLIQQLNAHYHDHLAARKERLGQEVQEQMGQISDWADTQVHPAPEVDELLRFLETGHHQLKTQTTLHALEKLHQTIQHHTARQMEILSSGLLSSPSALPAIEPPLAPDLPVLEAAGFSPAGDSPFKPPYTCSRETLCPPGLLASDEEITAYVQSIERQLRHILQDHDQIRIE